jgi:hypothetical protein
VIREPQTAHLSIGPVKDCRHRTDMQRYLAYADIANISGACGRTNSYVI